VTDNFIKQSRRRGNRKLGRRNTAPATAFKIPIAGRDNPLLLWGKHTVLAAILNPERIIHKIYCSPKNHTDISKAIDRRLTLTPQARIEIEVLQPLQLSFLVPESSVHQGSVAVVQEIKSTSLQDFLRKNKAISTLLVIILDQVTDPHNIGTVVRSAAAFSADAVIVHDRRTPKVDGVIAKAASGAIERLPLLRVTNIARSMRELKKHDFWCSGLTDDATTTIGEAYLDKRVALVLGAEGAGLRQLTRRCCDELIRLPTSADFTTLNISNAASVALYETHRRRTGTKEPRKEPGS
tara:strand:+ start:434 stop:1318 length:885 start_codon:yes stop_codon:yes gene_type:complete